MNYSGEGCTPESPQATHVFLQVARNFATDATHVAEFLRAMSTTGQRGIPLCWRRFSAGSAKTPCPP